MFLLNVPLEVAPGVVTCGAVNGKAEEFFFKTMFSSQMTIKRAK